MNSVNAIAFRHKLSVTNLQHCLGGIYRNSFVQRSNSLWYILYTLCMYNTIHMYSGITSGRVLNGELLYIKILEVNLFAFAYRLFRRDFSPLDGTYCMGTHSFLQPYMHFVLIWEGFMNG